MLRNKNIRLGICPCILVAVVPAAVLFIPCYVTVGAENVYNSQVQCS